MLSPTHSQREGDEESAAAGWARKAPKRAVKKGKKENTQREVWGLQAGTWKCES